MADDAGDPYAHRLPHRRKRHHHGPQHRLDDVDRVGIADEPVDTVRATASDLMLLLWKRRSPDHRSITLDGDRARLLKELDTMKAAGINNVRVLAVSEKTDMASAVRPATTAAPGQYDEQLLVGLDFMMAELAKRDMTAVIYLNNFWQWSGGMTQYLNWFEGTKALDPNVTKDYETYMRETARFFVANRTIGVFQQGEAVHRAHAVRRRPAGERGWRSSQSASSTRVRTVSSGGASCAQRVSWRLIQQVGRPASAAASRSTWLGNEAGESVVSFAARVDGLPALSFGRSGAARVGAAGPGGSGAGVLKPDVISRYI